MKIKSVIGLAMMFFMASRPSLAQGGVRNYEMDDLIKVVRISEKVIVVRTGVNYFEAVTAIATKKGIVLIDAGNTPQLTEKYRKIIARELGRDDFAFLINTHSHRDHTWGNQVFSDARIIGHELSRRAMIQEWNEQDVYAEMLRNGIKDASAILKTLDINSDEGRQAYYQLTRLSMIQADMESDTRHVQTLPGITFNDGMTLFMGDTTVEIMHFGNAHSAGDTWIYVPEEKLLLNGDVFLKNGAPNLTYFATEETPGIDEVKRWRKILDYLQRPDKAIETIVRGHGDILNASDLNNFSRHIAAIWSEFEKGKTIYPLSRIGNILEKEGVAAAKGEIQKLTTVDKDKYFFLERGFNVIGNRLQSPDKTAEFVALCELNVELFPRSLNAHNRLADAYVKARDKGKAIESYEKLLTLDPQNTMAVEQLKKLKGRAK